MMNTQLDPISVFSFGFDLEGLNVSRDRNPAIDRLRLRRQYVDDTLRISSQKIGTVRWSVHMYTVISSQSKRDKRMWI